MNEKAKLAISGVELLIGIGVSALVGGTLAIVKPSKAGPIKKIGMGLAGVAISSMASDKVIEYVDNKIHETIAQVKDFINKKHEEETSEEVEA